MTASPDHPDTPPIDYAAVEKLLAEHGVSLGAFCASVDINPSTWRRWRTQTHEPHAARKRAVAAEVARLKKEKRHER